MKKEVKYKYMHKWMDDVFNKLESLSIKDYEGGFAYSMLNLAYKIDYLLAPEGRIMGSN